MTPTVSVADSLQVKLLASILFHEAIAHNSPKANEVEEDAGIFTNYIQYFDNVVRNWRRVNDYAAGLPRLRTIFRVIKERSAVLVADNVWSLNHGTLAEFGKPIQERKNYAFYEGYSRLHFDLEKPVYTTGIHTGAGIQMKISDNIELYKANLADTFNMFDTAIINGTTGRRLIVNAKDSLLDKVNTDGLWVKGIMPEDDNDKSDKIWYTGVNAVRLPLSILRKGSVIVDTAFSLDGAEKMAAGDVGGKVVGGAEHSILKMQEISFNDTLENSQHPEVLLHGQSRILCFDSNYYNGDSLSFLLRCTEEDTGKISVIKVDATNAILHDTSVTVREIAATVIQWGNGGKPVSWFFVPHLMSRRIALKEAVDGKLNVNNYGDGYVAIRLEKDIDKWLPEYLRNGGKIKIMWNGKIRIYKDQSKSKSLQIYKDNLTETFTTDEMNWSEFYNLFLDKRQFIFLTFPYGTEKSELVFHYQNSKNPFFKKEEKVIINQYDEYIRNKQSIVDKLMSTCLCTSGSCRTESQIEAEKIANAYLDVFKIKANCDDAYSMRVNGQMDYVDSHNGWMCYQWTFFVHEVLSKIKLNKFKIQRSGYMEKNKVLHNWLTVFWQDTTMRRETNNAIHIDSWLKNAPFVFTTVEHEAELINLGLERRNFIAPKLVKKEYLIGYFIDEHNIVHKINNQEAFDAW